MPASHRTIAITPAHNEAASIAAVVAGILGQGIPAVVVDDGSQDLTSRRALEAGAKVIRLPSNYGVGAALRTGFRYAVRHGFDRVVQIDSDLQHDPASIPLLIAAADEGADLVIGSRFGSDYDAGTRRPAMRFLAALVKRQTGIVVDDPTSGFKVVTEPLLSEFARSYPAEYLGDTVEALLRAAAAGATIVQVRTPMSKRTEGDATPSSKAAAHFGRVLLAIGTGKSGKVPR